MSDGYYQPRPSLLDRFFNFLSALVLLATISLGGIFSAIYINPQIFFNPFPPPQQEPPPVIITPTAIPPTAIPPTAITPTEPALTQPTATTIMPLPSKTPPVETPEPTPVPFIIQPGTPAYTRNFLNDLECEWMGVAGQVLDQTDVDLWIHLGGELDGAALDLLSLPGSALGYGHGGYEFTLSNGPIATEDLIWIQLQDPSGNPMTEKLFLTTSGLCEENLLVVNWVRIP